MDPTRTSHGSATNVAEPRLVSVPRDVLQSISARIEDLSNLIRTVHGGNIRDTHDLAAQATGPSLSQPVAGEILCWVEQVTWTSMAREVAELGVLFSGGGGGVEPSPREEASVATRLHGAIASPPDIDWDYVDQIYAGTQQVDLGLDVPLQRAGQSG